MPEKFLKHQAFWFVVSFAFVAGLSLGGFLCSLVKSEQPPAIAPIHVIVHYQPVEQTHYEQWVGEVAISELQGKCSLPGKLSPETERSVEIHDMFKDGRDP